MRVLLDTDVILDVYLARQPFADTATEILRANRDGIFEAYVSAVTPINVYYFTRKHKDAEHAKRTIKDIITGVNICQLNYAILQAALSSSIADYEDAVQHASAISYQLDCIVTRNLDDYRKATLPVYSPSDFLVELQKQKPSNSDV
jgi:predicted nucleic acid-binding protein